MNRLTQNYHYVIVGILIAVGAFIRFNDFTFYGFTSADEYYIIKSVQNILERGLPEYATGGYYTRGILYQYISAGLILLGINDAAALRLPTILFNLFSIPLVYFIALKITNRNFAIWSVILFAFSVWEIELARFARFYTPFQFIFLIYLYYLLKIIADKETKHITKLYILTIIGVLFHEEGIFLAVLNFLPLYLFKDTNKVKILAASLVFILIAFLTLYNFRALGVVNTLPSDISYSSTGGSGYPVIIPKLLLPHVLNNAAWLVIYVIPVLLFFFFLRYFFKRDISIENKIYFLIIGTAILLNLFTLAGFILLLLVVLKRFDSTVLNKSALIVIFSYLIITVIFYFAYCFFNSDWSYTFYNKPSSLSRIILVLFNYPDVYEKFLLPWLRSFPVITVFTIVSAGFIIILFLLKEFLKFKVELNNYIFVLFSAVLILFFLETAIVTPYKSLRYWFTIYPVFLIFITYLVFRFKLIFKRKLIQNIAALVFFTVIILLSRDHNISHLYNVNSLTASFRINYPQRLASTYYYKEYYKSAGETVSGNYKPDDLIITTVAPVEYYLPRLDYYFRSYNDMEFSIRSRNGGKTEIWTNSNLIYKENDLLNMIKNSTRNVWLVTYSESRPGISDFEKELTEEYSEYLYYTTPEGSLNIYYITSGSKN